MEDRFSIDQWQCGMLGQPVLCNSLTSLAGEIEQIQCIGTHQLYLVDIKQIVVNETGNGLIDFKRNFHPVMREMDIA